MNCEKQMPSFRGDYEFMSNMYRCNVVYRGISFPTSEHAYVMAKVWNSENPQLIDPFELNLMGTGKVKRFGRKIVLKPYWDTVKATIMTEIVFAKFYQNLDIAQKLLDTGTEKIQEGNTWGDTFFGMVEDTYPSGVKYFYGENHLGEILTLVRNRLIRDRSEGLI